MQPAFLSSSIVLQRPSRALHALAKKLYGALAFLVMATAFAAAPAFAQAPDEADSPDSLEAASSDEAPAATARVPKTDPAPFDEEMDATPESAPATNDSKTKTVDEEKSPNKAATSDAPADTAESAGGETQPSLARSAAALVGLPPHVFAPLVTGGVAAVTLGVASLLGGIAVAVLIDTHFNSPATIDPWAGVFVAAPIFITTGLTTTLSGIFVLERGRGPMATGLATVGAAFAGAGLAAGAVLGIATLLEDGFPLARDLDPYLWTAGISATVVGTLAGTAAAAGMGFSFAPSSTPSDAGDE